MKLSLTKSAALILLATSIAACSGMPVPKTEMALSDSAVKDAELAGAREYAPLELRRAHEKFANANNALHDKDYAAAKHWSEEALVDAELAEAKSYSEKSRISLEELRSSIDLMREEISHAQSSES